jgi:hypothetical protein
LPPVSSKALNRLERALSGLSSQRELINRLARVLTHALERGRVAYHEIGEIISGDAEDVLLLGNEWGLIFPVRTLKSAAWEDRLLIFEPGEEYEIPNIVRYLVKEAKLTGRWEAGRALAELFRDMGEPNWEQIPELVKELGQQVAIIQFHDTTTASVDLFISILDQTGESHEIVFFVPLGVKAEGFGVWEQDSITFNDQFTNRLDMTLFQSYRQDQQFMQYLFAGALLTNGVWLTPLWLPLLFTGCAEPPPLISTFKTESSEVSIFGLDESTDLEALISTTGLDPSVTETLSRLRGQQIAVVNLHTQPQQAATGPASESAEPTGEPGLHLFWQTTLATGESGATYAYPLGTGAAWAHPIEMTRVYVLVPEELDFTMQYPKLGANCSGFVKKQSSYEPRIADSGEESAYAVDTATDVSLYPFRGRLNIWRVTYANSNAAEDILLTVNPSSGTSLGTSLRRAGTQTAFFIGLIVAALFWIMAWVFLMPRLLGKDRKIKGLWRLSLTYIGWNALLFVPGAILYFIFSFGAQAIALFLLVILFGAASVLTFALRHLNRLGVSTAQGIRAFVIVTLVSNGAYLLFVFGYAKLVDIF